MYNKITIRHMCDYMANHAKYNAMESKSVHVLMPETLLF